MKPAPAVAVTGLGVVSSAGIGKENFWRGLTSGRSFVRRITRFDASRMRVQIASEIDDADLAPHVGGRLPEVEERIFTYSAVAADLAVRDAALDPEHAPGARGGVVVGTSVGPSLVTGLAYLRGGAPHGLESATWSRGFPADIGRRLNRRFGLQGFSAVVSTGCASGADAVGVALEAIQWGHADLMLAVGTEAPIEPLTVNAFDAIGALSRRNDCPERASRPFDRDRDGFVLGEGAAVLVLESLEHARRRGARVYAELRSYVTTTDAFHMTAPRHDLSKSSLAARRALEAAGVGPDDIDYVSAHATSTPLGDTIETRLVKRVFGARAYQVPISSTKSVIGHQSGGAGVFQAVANTLTIERQTLVPTVNLEARGEGCDLDYVPGRPRPARVRHVLQHTFGFSGKNSMLVLSRPGEAPQAGRTA